MKTLSFLSLIFCASTVMADAPSSIPGITLGNSHALSVDAQGRPTVVRGMAPNKNNYKDFLRLGITDIVIFKNETENEVRTEIAALQSMGYRMGQNITHIPFPWKNMPDIKTTCRMTVAALLKIQQAENAGRRVYFHCTVGEDRTGYLAGLYQLVKGRSRDPREVFLREMCARGYEAGNPKKASGGAFQRVVIPIRKELTPAYLIMSKRLLQYGLVPDLCEKPWDQRLTPQEAGSFICR